MIWKNHSPQLRPVQELFGQLCIPHGLPLRRPLPPSTSSRWRLAPLHDARLCTGYCLLPHYVPGHHIILFETILGPKSLDTGTAFVMKRVTATRRSPDFNSSIVHIAQLLCHPPRTTLDTIGPSQVRRAQPSMVRKEASPAFQCSWHSSCLLGVSWLKGD